VVSIYKIVDELKQVHTKEKEVGPQRAWLKSFFEGCLIIFLNQLPFPYRMETEVSKDKLNKYFSLTKEAMGMARIIAPERTHLHKAALDFMDMARRYYTDAKDFKEKGKWVTAFAALNYAHGWLDAGARLGLFDVQHNSQLFTVD